MHVNVCWQHVMYYKIFDLRPARTASITESHLRMLPAGGVQIAGSLYAAPLYGRRHVSQIDFRGALASWQAQLPPDMLGSGLSIDVCIPTYRADPAALDR